MNTRVYHDWLQRLEHALGTRLWATRANVEIAPDHQSRDGTADMLGMAESIEAGDQIQLSQHLAGFRLQKVLALEQFGRVGCVERAYVHICFSPYARPNTTPRIRNTKYTLCAEWTMMPIQVLQKRQLGNAYRKTPLMTDP